MRTLLGCLLLAPALAHAVPFTMQHQGRLLDNFGVPVENTHQIVFRVHADSSNPADVWTETHPSVALADGYYAVTLGEITDLDTTVFDGSTRYLSVNVDDGGEFGARTALVSVPYAVRAGAADTAASLSNTATLSLQIRCETFRGIWDPVTTTCSPGAFITSTTSTYGNGRATCQALGAFHMCGFPEVTSYLPDLLARGQSAIGWVACGRPDAASSGAVKKIGISQDALDVGTGTCPAANGCNWESYFLHCYRTETTPLPVYCCRN